MPFSNFCKHGGAVNFVTSRGRDWDYQLIPPHGRTRYPTTTGFFTSLIYGLCGAGRIRTYIAERRRIYSPLISPAYQPPHLMFLRPHRYPVSLSWCSRFYLLTLCLCIKHHLFLAFNMSKNPRFLNFVIGLLFFVLYLS